MPVTAAGVYIPGVYIENARAVTYARVKRRGIELPGVQISLQDGTQRVLSFASEDDAMEFRQGLLQAVQARGGPSGLPAPTTTTTTKGTD